eukprot:7829234-Alexandrium_andersonii.AAC.1
MSASLVGSEMCIRDRRCPSGPTRRLRVLWALRPVGSFQLPRKAASGAHWHHPARARIAFEQRRVQR